MKVWMLLFTDDGWTPKVKLFGEDKPPSIDKICSVLKEWEFTEDTILKVAEAFLRGYMEWEKAYCCLTLSLEDVE